MSVTVRFFEHPDVDGILRLYKGAGVWFEEVEVNREFIVSSSQRPDFRFMVAVDGGVVVGFIGALYFKGVGRAELGPIGVDDAYKGAGVGGRLTEAMLGFLCGEGVRHVIVKVKASNRRALSFFLKSGFDYEAYLRSYTLKGEDVVQMIHHL